MNHDSNKPNTAGIKIGLPNSSNKGFDIKAGIIESNPNVPYNVNIPNNNLKLYDSKDKYNHTPSVKVKKELNKLWERLTKNTRELPNDIDKRHGKPIYKRMLDDGTNINYRTDSKTGGATIDVNSRNPKTNIKIHIDKGM